ncbi:hypothetical protein [Sandarakinorhabdus sp.]|uniref:hypothetical protein n=1 Tax=Sandarakinorhabdus sp. TaxID=1916663 RepID=UPI00334128BF
MFRAIFATFAQISHVLKRQSCRQNWPELFLKKITWNQSKSKTSQLLYLISEHWIRELPECTQEICKNVRTDFQEADPPPLLHLVWKRAAMFYALPRAKGQGSRRRQRRLRGLAETACRACWPRIGMPDMAGSVAPHH